MKTKKVESEKNYSVLNLSAIIANDFNPRKRFSESNLKELAENIKTQGVLQPILVRPIEGNKYVIIAGERRYRASILANLQTIPATIREMSDDEAEEAAISENMQRKDITPCEEAAALQRLIETNRYSVSDLSCRFGKSEAYIRTRLRLINLIPQITELLEDEIIAIGTAEEYSKYSKDIQEDIFSKHLESEDDYNSWRDIKVKKLVNYIERTYTTKLDNFCFDKSECMNCIHNSNNLTLFAENQSCGSCTNPSCLQAKNNSYMIDKAIKMVENNSLISFYSSRWSRNQEVIQELTEKGYEIAEDVHFISSPNEPEIPQEDDYEDNEDYTEAINDYQEELSAYQIEKEAFEKEINNNEYIPYAVIGEKDITLRYAQIVSSTDEDKEQVDPIEAEIVKLENKAERNTEIAKEKIVEEAKKLVQEANFIGEFSAEEEKALYYFMLSSLKKEHFQSVGIEDTYYLNSEKKQSIINNLTEDIKNIIRRDYLVANLKSAFGKNVEADLLISFCHQHLPLDISAIEDNFNDIYKKRNHKIEDKITVLNKQAKREANKASKNTQQNTEDTNKQSKEVAA